MLGLAGLVAAGAAAFVVLSRGTPPPRAIADDPLLVEGRAIYLARCVSCHGESGKGDGPIAKGLSGPPPRDLTDREWKHGDAPERVLAVVRRGVRDTAMPGWEGQVDVRAVTAYVYWLAGREVPESLRAPGRPG